MEEKKTPNWEYRKTFKINERMKEIVKLTIESTNMEIDILRRKLEKLQYGS